MGIKDYFLRQALEYKLKNVPQQQKEVLISLMENNPEFFKKIGDEIQKRVKSGQSELSASMAVMRENQSELQKIMLNK